MTWEIKDKATATPAIDDYVPFQTSGGTTRKATPLGIADAACAAGHLYYDSSGFTTAAMATGTWYPINSTLAAGEFVELSYTLGSTDSIDSPAGLGGLYEVSLHASFDVSAAGTYEISIAVNGTACASGCKARVPITAAGAKGLSLGARILARLSAGDALSVQVRNTATNGTTATFYVIGLTVNRVGD